MYAASAGLGTLFVRPVELAVGASATPVVKLGMDYYRLSLLGGFAAEGILLEQVLKYL